MRTSEEILNRYKHLYSALERSEDLNIMNVFGKAENWAFARMLELSFDDAKRWLEKLEPTEWNNYLSREEANEIVSGFINQDGTRGAHWSFESAKQVIEKNGWDISDEPYFNCYALWVTMNILGSSSTGFFTAILDRTHDLSPKITDPFAHGLYGIIPHQGNFIVCTFP